jgi:monoamine oxidase
LYPEFSLTHAERNTSINDLSNYAYSSILRGLPAEIRKEFFKTLPSYSSEYATYLNLSNRQVFEKLGLSQDGITLLAGVNPLTGGLLNTSYGETLQEVYSLDYDNLYRISGGMDTLPKAFYGSLTSKTPTEYGLNQEDLGSVIIKQGHIVTGIYNTSQQDSILIKYSAKNKKDIMEVFDYVICAIPLSTLREIDINPLFSNQKMQAIRELHYVDALKASFLCNKRFWEEDTDYGRMNGGISTTDLPIQSILYPTDHVNCTDDASCLPKEPGVLTAAYNINYDSIRIANQSEEKRYQLIRHNVEQIHGLADGYLDKIIDDIKIIDWNKEPWSRGAYVTDLPGQKINFSYSILEPEYNNHLFFAGEHTSVKHGWMQGALHSGMLAANTLAHNKKRIDDNN